MLAAANKDAAALRERLRGDAAGLSDLPVLSGEAFAEAVAEQPPFGRFGLAAEDLIRAGLTTAAVPRPTPIAWSRADLDREAELGARLLRRAGLAARTRTSDTLDGGLVAPGTLAVTDALDALDALALPVGPVRDAAALGRVGEVWDVVRPAALILDPASFRFLYGADGYARPRAFVVVLTPADGERLAAAPHDDVYRIFSLPQVNTWIAGECRAHAGLHLNDDAVIAEVAGGRLVLTARQRTVVLPRYDSGIAATIDTAPCACGEASPRLRFGA
ncbi:MAG: hypothetical protein SF182_27495 [Deltaproteobacteria bacterium]|nr:hypothetical protein [Deltaproteobacteria bacterium]